MKINKKLFMTGLISAGIVTAALGTSVAFAATTSTTNAFMDRVAQILGIDSSKLTSAVTQASTEKIDQMLKDGKITQDQADKMKADAANGNFKMIGGEMRGGRFGGGKEMDNLVTFLGITKDDLQTQLKAGKTLTEIITGKGKTVADAKTYLVKALTDELNQEVKDGKITQAQADSRIARQSAMIDNFLNGTMPKGGPRGGRHMNDNNNDDMSTGTTPTTSN